MKRKRAKQPYKPQVRRKGQGKYQRRRWVHQLNHMERRLVASAFVASNGMLTLKFLADVFKVSDSQIHNILKEYVITEYRERYPLTNQLELQGLDLEVRKGVTPPKDK